MTIHGVTITKKQIISVILITFIILFARNLLRGNRNADTPDSEVLKNVQLVSEHDFSTVKAVEEQISVVEKSDEVNEKIQKGEGLSKAKYKKIFSGCVVIGDSITEGLSLYGFLNKDQVFSEIGASIMSSKSMFKKAAATYPRVAFFTFGMNDMGNYRGDADAFIKRYKELLADFAEKTPDTKILINSISTPRKSAQKSNKSLKNYKKFNKAIQAMCDELGYTYIENTYILEQHPKYYEQDGIHVIPDYYPIWLNNMILMAGL